MKTLKKINNISEQQAIELAEEYRLFVVVDGYEYECESTVAVQYGTNGITFHEEACFLVEEEKGDAINVSFHKNFQEGVVLSWEEMRQDDFYVEA